MLSRDSDYGLRCHHRGMVCEMEGVSEEFLVYTKVYIPRDRVDIVWERRSAGAIVMKM